jgi:hypothetical protein
MVHDGRLPYKQRTGDHDQAGYLFDPDVIRAHPRYKEA